EDEKQKITNKCEFRTTFKFPERAKALNWFPGHMLKTTKEIQARLSSVNVVVEVRDARVPFSSRNDRLDDEIRARNKRKLIVFNKTDLAHPNTPKLIADKFKDVPTLFTSATKGVNIKDIVSTSLKHHKIVRKFKTIPIVFMVVGIPNVGKSSIINALKNKYAHTFDHKEVRGKAKVGATPGLTRSINFFKVCEKPEPCVVLDSPGVFVPTISTYHQAFRLALINAIPDALSIDNIDLCDYLLFELNKHKQFLYVTVFKLPHATDSIQQLLHWMCSYLQAYQTNGEDDIIRATSTFIRYFRSGKLGRLTLEVEEEYDGVEEDKPNEIKSL
ncbi:hypothetical protein AKO1_015768, partial [Acrasis kona]